MLINFYKKHKCELLSFFTGIFLSVTAFYVLYILKIIHISEETISEKIISYFPISNNTYLNNNYTFFNASVEYLNIEKLNTLLEESITPLSTNSDHSLPPPLVPLILPSLGIGINEYPWKCIPSLMIPVRINQDLYAECMSFNKYTCLHTTKLEDCNLLAKTNFTELSPLECGAKHLALYGTDGYSDTTHWCYITVYHYYEY